MEREFCHCAQDNQSVPSTPPIHPEDCPGGSGPQNKSRKMGDRFLDDWPIWGFSTSSIYTQGPLGLDHFRCFLLRWRRPWRPDPGAFRKALSLGDNSSPDLSLFRTFDIWYRPLIGFQVLSVCLILFNVYYIRFGLYYNINLLNITERYSLDSYWYTPACVLCCLVFMLFVQQLCLSAA